MSSSLQAKKQSVCLPRDCSTLLPECVCRLAWRRGEVCSTCHTRISEPADEQATLNRWLFPFFFSSLRPLSPYHLCPTSFSSSIFFLCCWCWHYGQHMLDGEEIGIHFQGCCCQVRVSLFIMKRDNQLTTVTLSHPVTVKNQPRVFPMDRLVRKGLKRKSRLK